MATWTTGLKTCFAALGGMALFLTGCAAPTIKATFEAGPSNLASAQLKRVAVLPFQGPNGDQAARQFESMLAEAKGGGSTFFTVVDRHTLQKAVDELKLQGSGLIDPNTAAQIGRLTGAEGIYTGTVSSPPPARKTYRMERMKCLDAKRKLFKCDNISRTTVNCTEKVIQYTLVPRLINVATGQVVYAPTKTGNRSETFCSDAGAETPDATLLSAAADDAFSQVRNDIAPHTYTVDLRLKDSDDGLNGPGKTRFADSLAFARANRMDRACAIWSELARDNPSSIAVAYNLAACDEGAGRLDEAVSKYMAVDKNLSRPDKDINEALARVQRALGERRNLELTTQTPGSAQQPTTKWDRGARVPASTYNRVE